MLSAALKYAQNRKGFFAIFAGQLPFSKFCTFFLRQRKSAFNMESAKKGGGTRKSGFVRLFALVKLSEAHDGNVRHDGVLAREYAPRLLLRYP